ncbi:MAG: hypothetical protein NTY20_03915 [Candidatus Aenigmarchaeota archaeon]|nr:hypothetical protein [Candidatus Aenigmarchaeota archaeon]
MAIKLTKKLRVPIIDLHAHLRNDVAYHTSIAKDSGIDFAVAMPNTPSCLDTVRKIKEYSGRESAIPFAVTSAITKGREGKKLVDIIPINKYVVGFTDDGNCLKDLHLLYDIMESYQLVMLHAGDEDPLDKRPRNTTEPHWVQKYLELNSGREKQLYIQHISRKESVDLIRQAKKSGITVTAETCPHYFKWTRDTMRVPVNPPIGGKEDREAVREGLSDGTIDVIASDYAPEPRPKGTGIADWENYRGSCMQLVADGIVTEDQLISLVYKKPLSIITNSFGYTSGRIKIPKKLMID